MTGYLPFTIEMRLTAMSDAFIVQKDDPKMKDVFFEDRFGMLVDIEYSNRKSNGIKRLITNAGFDQTDAAFVDINYTSGRKLNRELINRLATWNTSRSTGICSLLVRREAERHIWHAPSVWKPASDISRQNMSVYPISSLNLRLLGTKEHIKKFRSVMLILFSSSLMNGSFLSLRRQRSMIS